MKIIVTENRSIQIEELYNDIVLKTADGEIMTICMRDSGFEFSYEGKPYFAKEGYLEPFNKSVRGNYLLCQSHMEDGSSGPSSYWERESKPMTNGDVVCPPQSSNPPLLP